MGLSWLSPIFLAGAATALIPIALHLCLRRRAPVVDFAAMRYLRTAAVEREDRRRLKEWLLLALRVAALVFLAVAFARPFFVSDAAAPAGPATVVMLDVSASMSAPGQFDRARALAMEALATVPAAEPVAVVTFGGAATIVAPLSVDRAVARRAIQDAELQAGATRFADALTASAAVFGSRQGKLLVVSDAQSSGWDVAGRAGVPDNVAVELIEVVGPGANVAVDGLRRDGNDAVASVRNYSSRQLTLVVTFEQGSRTVARVTVVAPPYSIGEARFGLDGEGGELKASVADTEGYTADNARYAVLGQPRPTRVILVSSSGAAAGSVYVRRALEAGESDARRTIRTVAGVELSSERSAPLDETDVAIVLSTKGIDPRGRERLAGFLQAGGSLLVAAGPEVDLSVINGLLSQGVGSTFTASETQRSLTLAPRDLRHPILRSLGEFGTLALADFRRAVTVVSSPGANVLARFSDGGAALVEEVTSGDGHVLLFGSDLNNEWNNLPLQPAFAPFIHETVSYLATRRAERIEYYAGELPQAGGDVPGFVRLEGGANRLVAVNVDPAESNPARLSKEAFVEAIVPLTVTAGSKAAADADASEAAQGLWQYGLGMVLCLLTAEGALARRMG